MNDQTYLVEFHAGLLETVGTRNGRGDLLTVEMGEVTEHAQLGVIVRPRGYETPLRTLPVYVPTLTVDFTDNIAIKVMHRYRHRSKNIQTCDCKLIVLSLLEHIE